jgi:hypothetical protein
METVIRLGFPKLGEPQFIPQPSAPTALDGSENVHLTFSDWARDAPTAAARALAATPPAPPRSLVPAGPVDGEGPMTNPSASAAAKLNEVNPKERLSKKLRRRDIAGTAAMARGRAWGGG